LKPSHSSGGTARARAFVPLAAIPRVLADGTRLAINSTRSGNFDIWIMDVDVELLKKELQELN
jgi:Tol biopolymer transport system component